MNPTRPCQSCGADTPVRFRTDGSPLVRDYDDAWARALALVVDRGLSEVHRNEVEDATMMFGSSIRITYRPA